MKSLRSIPALGAFFVVIALAVSACGSSIPSNSVAVVAGNPISTQAFDHWMYVLAKTQAAQSPGQPVIVPNDPPNFSKCIAQVKAEIPSLAKTATKTLKADCQRVFTSLSSTVLDYLIKAYWYQATAHKLGIKITPAQEVQWNEVAATMRENAKDMDQAIDKRTANAPTATAIDDLKAYADIAQTHANGVKKLATTFSGLYSALSDDQKKAADEAFNHRGHESKRVASR